ncbi:MAG: hypothetical protein R2694_05265 [Ilumatobacteraceae bacterium]
MEAVRRAHDGELCGHVVQQDRTWVAMVVFGAVIGTHDTREAAEAHVLRDGLAVLADRWTLRNLVTGADEIVCIQEAHPGSVTLALGYYSMPGVPTLTLTADELAGGTWALVR